MAKGSIGGGTDYSHQTLDDIKSDLISEAKNAKDFINMIEEKIEKLETIGYWNSNVPYDFKSCVAYALRHYSTTIHEIEDIVSDFPSEIKEHHCVRLRNIGQVARQIDTDISQIWYRRDFKKEYETPNFLMLEDVCADTQQMAINLLDINNMASRLEQFIGRKTMVNNPWPSGLFYFFVALVFLITLAGISNWVSWYALLIVVIGGVLLVGAIGALQLRNDDRLKEENFIKLMLEVIKRLPLKLKKEKGDE